MTVRATLRRAVNSGLARGRPGVMGGRILLYHHIRPAADPIESVAPDLFRAQLDWLARAGQRTVSVAELRRVGPEPGAVALSFDDGYESVGPACREVLARGWSATLFVVPGWIDSGRSGLLSWSDIADLARAGIEVGSHGLDHAPLCDRDARRMALALSAARERIRDRIGAEVDGLAFPHGLAPARARLAASLAGSRYACTTVPGRNGPAVDPFGLRRNEVLGTDDREALLLAKVGGSDDWMGPVRTVENTLRCGR